MKRVVLLSVVSILPSWGYDNPGLFNIPLKLNDTHTSIGASLLE